MAKVKQLILASTSPFRQKLLAGTGLAFKVKAPEVDESSLWHEVPAELARLRAEAKAMDVASKVSDALVIGADQVLSCDGRSFDKVETLEEAAHRLKKLAGKTHQLHSALALAYQGEERSVPVMLVSRVIDVAMPMRPLKDKDIEAYLATGEWRGSVGCYQFENRGVHLFEDVAADQAAIVGLPLQVLMAELRRLGIDGLLAPKGPWVAPGF